MDGIKTVCDLIDLHIADIEEIGKEIGRSKEFSLDLLRTPKAAARPHAPHQLRLQVDGMVDELFPPRGLPELARAS